MDSFNSQIVLLGNSVNIVTPIITMMEPNAKTDFDSAGC